MFTYKFQFPFKWIKKKRSLVESNDKVTEVTRNHEDVTARNIHKPRSPDVSLSTI